MGYLKKEWRLILLIALGVVALVNVFTTNRPLGFYKIPQFARIATVPDTPELADIRRNAEISSGFMPNMGLVCCFQKNVLEQPVHIGWAYEEHGFLGMPYFANDTLSVGPTLYVDNGVGYQMAGISRDQLRRLEEALGSPVVSQYQFRWYMQVWGVLFPFLLGLLAWMWLSERRKREEAEWLEETPALDGEAG